MYMYIYSSRIARRRRSTVVKMPPAANTLPPNAASATRTPSPIRSFGTPAEALSGAAAASLESGPAGANSASVPTRTPSPIRSPSRAETEEAWVEAYAELVDYSSRHGHAHVSRREDVLGRWVQW